LWIAFWWICPVRGKQPPCLVMAHYKLGRRDDDERD
jgi:hypothetical protein